MIILGLYAGHDSNACLVKDGTLLCHVESERTTRMKHQQGLHRLSIERMFEYCNVKIEDVDVIAIGGTTVLNSIDPFVELEDIAKRMETEALHRFVYPQIFSPNRWSDARVINSEAKLLGKNVKVYLTDHHLSHAALTYYTSPYDSAKIISWDGGGDGAYVMLGKGEGGRITEAVYNPPDWVCRLSIGGTWTEMGKLYGEGVGGGVDYEGKIMGHAAYGERDDRMADCIKRYMLHYQLLSKEEKAALIEQLKNMVNFASFRDVSCMNFSASLQGVTEEVMMGLADMWVKPGEKLCVSGGCAYNCVANGKLWEKHKEMFVSNIPHDGGLSIGSALYVWHHVLGNEFEGVKWWSPYSGLGTGEAGNDIAEMVVDDLLRGKIVAWHNGRSEGGKRALGNRSILMDPRIIDGKDRLNNKVKHREWFRPFAPSIVKGPYGWFGNMPESRYMGFSCQSYPSWVDKVPAVMHVDGSYRPHIVSEESNPMYFKIIELLYEATGIPMVLNTSLNIGEPICDSEGDSRRTFKMANGGIDVLYVNGKRETY